MKPKSRLGRGLSSLITSTEPDATPTVELSPPAGVSSGSDSSIERLPAEESSAVVDRVIELPIESIAPNPHQPRRQFDEERLAELAASLKTTGIIQPVIVRHVDGEYQLIAGERRWRAAQHAGLSTLPAIVRTVDSAAQAQMALVENIQREDLNPLERASAYCKMMETLSLTQNELASRLGENRSAIAHYIRLLDLHPEVQELIRDGRLLMGHGKLLVSIEDLNLQAMLAKKVVEMGWSVRELEQQLEIKEKPDLKPDIASRKIYQQSLSNQIGQSLGLRAQLTSSKQGKGRLVIHYGSNEQFEQLMQRLGIAFEE